MSYCNMDERNQSETEQAHKQGFLAAVNKLKVGDNPHDENSNLHWQWMNGFSLALQQKNN